MTKVQTEYQQAVASLALAANAKRSVLKMHPDAVAGSLESSGLWSPWFVVESWPHGLVISESHTSEDAAWIGAAAKIKRQGGEP